MTWVDFSGHLDCVKDVSLLLPILVDERISIFFESSNCGVS